VARWAGTSASGLAWIGGLYGANLTGGVTGSVLAGFYLLRVYDMAVATYAAAFLNVSIAVGTAALARRAWTPVASDRLEHGLAATLNRPAG
jgi:spermidine synthase